MTDEHSTEETTEVSVTKDGTSEHHEKSVDGQKVTDETREDPAD
jgi:hypothetical protein